MHHPDPSYACRRFALRTLNGKPRIVFRANPLNRRSLWGKPVPFYLDHHTADLSRPDDVTPNPTLVHEDLHMPMLAYLKCFEATAHYPDDAPHRLISYQEDADEPSALLREYNPRARGGRFGTADYQERLKDHRNVLACEMVHRFIDLFSEKDPQSAAFNAIKEVASRLGMDPVTLHKVLIDRENFTFQPPRIKRTRVQKEGGVAFSRSDDFGFMYKELHAAVQILRTSAYSKYNKGKPTAQTAFSIDDLAVPDAPGGYATRCPVTGLELVWGESEGASMYSPKVGRRDVTRSYTSGNVLVMSRFARRLIECSGKAESLYKFMRNKMDIAASVRAWLALYPTPGVETLLREIELIHHKSQPE